MIWIAIVLALIPFSAGAQEGTTVLINEIAWMGTSVEGIDSNQQWRYEWLELRNTIERPIVLNGWSVELYRGEEIYFQIPLAGSVPASGYFLIGASEKIPNLDVNYANLGGKFVNTGMKVVLKDTSGNIADEVDGKDGWPAGDNETKRTMEKTDQGWQTSLNSGGTPKQENSAGFSEPELEEFFSANKKDPFRSSQEFGDFFTATTLLALLLALGSAAALVVLRRRLARA